MSEHFPGEHCPINLPTLHWLDIPEPIDIEPRTFDDEHTERGKRINGHGQCPKCGLWWPCIEEPDCWEECDDVPGRWLATGWWGAVVCAECCLLLVNQPDGQGECYQLDT